MQVNETLKLWEYFNINWSESIIPKKAISDHLMENSYGKYDIDDHIYFLEFVTEKDNRRFGTKNSTRSPLRQR